MAPGTLPSLLEDHVAKFDQDGTVPEGSSIFCLPQQHPRLSKAFRGMIPPVRGWTLSELISNSAHYLLFFQDNTPSTYSYWGTTCQFTPLGYPSYIDLISPAHHRCRLHSGYCKLCWALGIKGGASQTGCLHAANSQFESSGRCGIYTE